MTTRILIADDQQLVRAGFRLILAHEPEIEVVGEAGTGAEAIAATRSLRPDVVLMDIRMPGLDGIEATRRILGAPGTERVRVLILTTFDLDEYVYEALRAGASGFLLKDAPARQLVEGIHMVADGDALLAPAITRRLVEEFTAARTPAPELPGLSDLTARELEVFRLIAKGRSNAQIAGELFLGENTVKTHVTRVLSKLAARDRVHLVVLAYESGVVTPSREARPTGADSPLGPQRAL